MLLFKNDADRTRNTRYYLSKKEEKYYNVTLMEETYWINVLDMIYEYRKTLGKLLVIANWGNC